MAVGNSGGFLEESNIYEIYLFVFRVFGCWASAGLQQGPNSFGTARSARTCADQR